jgi:ATP-dependent Lon protease
MLRLARMFKGGPMRRYYSEELLLEDVEEVSSISQSTELIRLLPIAKHPIFPKHYIRFKLSLENFKFLVADPHSNYAGAFVVKPKDEKNELETNTSLLSILPLKNIDQVYSIGSLCTTNFNKFDKTIYLKPINRTKLIEVVEPASETIPFPLIKVQHIPEPTKVVSKVEDEQALKVLFGYLDELKSLLTPSELSALEVFGQRYNMKYDLDLVNFLGVVLSYMCDTHKIQKIFEPEDLGERVKLTAELVKESTQLRNSMRKLQFEAQEKMNKASEEHIYKEILSIIKSKLGHDRDDKETLKAKYLKNLEGKIIPEHINKIINEELEKFMMTDKNSHESHVMRNYLDWITSLPYGVCTEEILDLAKAKEILDRDHYGMKDVKDRILEFIAVSKLRGTSTGKILCFAGPPGVGKTSIAKSIAEALNRKYYRISVGGLDDVAELKGHRRTYIGAQPGKIISALKTAASENAVILIDEIDKIGKRNYQGSPENTLLEILDPVQNGNFNDYYIDAPIDLSKILFLCTANYPEDISPILMDRMDVINVQGYTAEEKLVILNKHLYPQALKKYNMEDRINLLEITDSAKSVLIQDYCREAGVRSLQKITTRILEKIARNIVEGNTGKITVDKENLIEYAGRPKFTEKKLYETLPPGVVMGLAYTTMGGSVLYIEISKSKFLGEETEGKIQMTGNLKQVMSESIQISHIFAKKFSNDKGNNFLDKHSIHIHVPEGATPKDGPSAGITITTALLSLAFNKPVIPNLAMTGEISLNGKVLAIGGLKEKVVAAKREDVRTIILPKQNKHNWEELTDTLKEGITPYFVEDYNEVFDIAFS